VTRTLTRRNAPSGTSGKRRLVFLAPLVGVVLTGCSNGPATPPQTLAFTNMPAAVITLAFDTTTEHVVAHFEGYGLDANESYTLHVHRGSCLVPTKTALITFEPVRGDASGAATVDVRSESSVPAGIPKGAYIDLHAGTSPAMDGCTDIPRRNPTAPLRLFAPPTHKALGSVIARYEDGRTLELRFEVMGLDAFSAHTVDVRTGPCTGRGSIIGDPGTLSGTSTGAASLKMTVHVARDPRGFHADVYTADSGDTLLLCADVPAYHPPKS